jgi:hypothetical protein
MTKTHVCMHLQSSACNPQKNLYESERGYCNICFQMMNKIHLQKEEWDSLLNYKSVFQLLP